jgi:hypothetical protein
MAEANPLWGAPRIHGELLKLGIETSERTVSRLMPRRGKAPSPTWKASLNNHVQDLVAIDFFTVPTATFRDGAPDGFVDRATDGGSFPRDKSGSSGTGREKVRFRESRLSRAGKSRSNSSLASGPIDTSIPEVQHRLRS